MAVIHGDVMGKAKYISSREENVYTLSKC